SESSERTVPRNCFHTGASKSAFDPLGFFAAGAFVNHEAQAGARQQGKQLRFERVGKPLRRIVAYSETDRDRRSLFHMPSESEKGFSAAEANDFASPVGRQFREAAAGTGAMSPALEEKVILFRANRHQTQLGEA